VAKNSPLPRLISGLFRPSHGYANEDVNGDAHGESIYTCTPLRERMRRNFCLVDDEDDGDCDGDYNGAKYDNDNDIGVTTNGTTVNGGWCDPANGSCSKGVEAFSADVALLLKVLKAVLEITVGGTTISGFSKFEGENSSSGNSTIGNYTECSGRSVQNDGLMQNYLTPLVSEELQKAHGLTPSDGIPARLTAASHCLTPSTATPFSTVASSSGSHFSDDSTATPFSMVGSRLRNTGMTPSPRGLTPTPVGGTSADQMVLVTPVRRGTVTLSSRETGCNQFTHREHPNDRSTMVLNPTALHPNALTPTGLSTLNPGSTISFPAAVHNNMSLVPNTLAIAPNSNTLTISAMSAISDPSLLRRLRIAESTNADLLQEVEMLTGQVDTLTSRLTKNREFRRKRDRKLQRKRDRMRVEMQERKNENAFHFGLSSDGRDGVAGGVLRGGHRGAAWDEWGSMAEAGSDDEGESEGGGYSTER
jgi:hypothetical protein